MISRVRAFVFVLSLAAAMVTTAGCSYQRAAMSGMRLPAQLHLEELKRSDYSVMQSAEGKGCATYVALWPLPIFWVSSDHKSATLYNWTFSGLAEAAATYNAIKSVEGADAILAPQFSEDGVIGGIWYRRSCVTVRGKAISIKTDE